jgi:surface carbohydrate biosynthesis protein
MGKRTVDLLLLVEHVARELDIACVVKYLMNERHGVTVEIASLLFLHGFQKTLARYEPGVVAMPFFYSATDHGPINVIKGWPNAVHVNLAYEQIFSNINKTYKAPKDTISQQNILHHAWSPYYASYLESHNVPPANIFVNGNPFYTLYRKPYNSYFVSRDELAKRYNLDPQKRWVFVPENYGAAFYGEAKLKDYVKFGLDDAYNYRDFAMASFKEAIKWWQQAARSPNVEMIVRPRPAIPLGLFTKTCEDALGEPLLMHVIKEGTVREWILASDIVMSSYSTTLIEASVANKPVYMLEPILFPDYVQADWYDLVPQLTTLKDFMKVINEPGITNTCQPLQNWAVQSMMNSDDPIAHLADWLAGICKKQVYIPPRPDLKDIQALKLDPDQAQHKKPVNLLSYPGKVVDYLWRKVSHPEFGTDGVPIGHQLDKIDQADVRRRINRWATVCEQDSHL